MRRLRTRETKYGNKVPEGVAFSLYRRVLDRTRLLRHKHRQPSFFL